ncbi:hypothetical protein [Actinophytocola sp.]|uniref:hypothetical protein n=1 Tax=Actinophytocola sp. TaxID=1872138 RepID=UPI00389AB609
MDVTDIEPIDLIGVDVEEYGWRYDRSRTAIDAYVEIFARGAETLEFGWAFGQDPGNPTTHLLSPIHINDTEWPVSSPADVTRALDEDRRLAQPLPTIYDASPRRYTPEQLYQLRRQMAGLAPDPPPWDVNYEPVTRSGAADAGRSRTLDLDPNLPPWEMDHDGLVVYGPPQPQVIEPGDPDWPPWLSTEPLWDPPSQEESDPRRDRERAAGAADVVAEFGGETTGERLGLGTDGMGEALEAASAEATNLRGYSIRDLAAAIRDGDPWTWGNTAPNPPSPPEPRPRVMRVTLPDGRTAYMDAPAPTAPEAWYSPDTMRVERGGEVPASQRFAAMDPDQVQAARGLLRDYPDTVPFDEVGRRRLTLEDVSLVYAADIGDLPDVTTTDPWRPPAAAPWQSATTAPDPRHDDPQRDREPAAGTADVVPERDGATTPQRPGPGPDATDGNPEITAIRTALDRLVEGEVTDQDLARIGLTPDQYERLVSGDVNADIDRGADQHRVEFAADAESATAHPLPDREQVDPVYASLTGEHHETNRRDAYDAWTNTVRREWAERDRAPSDTGPSPAANDDAVALDNDGDEPGFRRQGLGDDLGGNIGGDVAVGGAPTRPTPTPQVASVGVPRLGLADRAIRQVISDHPAADPPDRSPDRIDRLRDRLNDIQHTVHNSARERAPTSDASPDTSARQGGHVSPDISDGLDPPYGYPADTATTDPQYQQSEINTGPEIDI